MRYVLTYESVADFRARVPAHLAAHRALWKRFQDEGSLLLIGPFTDEPAGGAMGVFTTRAAAEAFVAADPFVSSGIVARYTVREWAEAIVDTGGTAPSPSPSLSGPPDRGFPEWEPLYQNQPVESMPWFFADLDPDVRDALAAGGIRDGALVDLGTGPGTQAIALARAGFIVTGTDLSASAVEKAAARARAEGVTVTFVRDDVLAPTVRGPFRVALDRGLFHVLAPEARGRYADNIAALLEPGGLLLLKCFSTQQPGTVGPHRLAPEDLRQVFTPRFDVESIRDTIYHGSREPSPQALFAVLRRRA
jgi:uncharacterized protein YciI/2-polyprenyl-3-methyl-5-hydroxy-6-metoxy-1,4-benzoquinol methylase